MARTASNVRAAFTNTHSIFKRKSHFGNENSCGTCGCESIGCAQPVTWKGILPSRQTERAGLVKVRVAMSSRPLLGPAEILGAQRKLEWRRVVDRSLVAPSLVDGVEDRCEVERDVRVTGHQRTPNG